MAVMRKTVPGQAASIPGTTPRSRSNVPRPAASGRLKSCALAEPSMESSSEKPCFFMKPVRSGVRSVPFVVTEKRIRSPSSSCTHSASGRIISSNLKSGSPPKKFISGTVPALRAFSMRKRAAAFAVSSVMLSGSFRTKQ